MDTSSGIFRRRWSSSAADHLEEPNSPGADGRRPTLTAFIGTVHPHKIKGDEQKVPLLARTAELTPPSSRDSTIASAAYVMAPEYMTEDDFHTAPVRTTAELCQELEMFYPLQRQACRTEYINDVGGYSGPVVCSDEVTLTVRACRHAYLLPVESAVMPEVREQPMMRRMSRRVSSAGRQARKWSGELGRRASKLLRMNVAPDVVRNKHREGFDLEQDWYPQVDLGREIVEDDDQWRRNIERDFRLVEWS